MSALPTRRRVVPTTFMALGFLMVVAGSFGFGPVANAAENTQYATTTTVYNNGTTSTTAPTTTVPVTTTVPETTTTVPETTTSMPYGSTTTTAPTTTTTSTTSTTVPKTTTTVPETTTTVPQTTTTVAKTTTTVPVKVSPATTIKPRPTVSALAVTGSDSSLTMVGMGVALFVVGLVLFEIRAARAA